MASRQFQTLNIKMALNYRWPFQSDQGVLPTELCPERFKCLETCCRADWQDCSGRNVENRGIPVSLAHGSMKNADPAGFSD